MNKYFLWNISRERNKVWSGPELISMECLEETAGCTGLQKSREETTVCLTADKCIRFPEQQKCHALPRSQNNINKLIINLQKMQFNKFCKNNN